MEGYFVIHNSDGDATVDFFTKEDLLTNLNDGYWGDVGFINSIEQNDTNYWGESILIIKGKIAVPEVATIVTSYEVK